MTRIGNAVYLSMDLPDTFLAVREVSQCHLGLLLSLFVYSSQNS